MQTCQCIASLTYYALASLRHCCAAVTPHEMMCPAQHHSSKSFMFLLTSAPQASSRITYCPIIKHSLCYWSAQYGCSGLLIGRRRHKLLRAEWIGKKAQLRGVGRFCNGTILHETCMLQTDCADLLDCVSAKVSLAQTLP